MAERHPHTRRKAPRTLVVRSAQLPNPRNDVANGGRCAIAVHRAPSMRVASRERTNATIMASVHGDSASWPACSTTICRPFGKKRSAPHSARFRRAPAVSLPLPTCRHPARKHCRDHRSKNSKPRPEFFQLKIPERTELLAGLIYDVSPRNESANGQIFTPRRRSSRDFQQQCGESRVGHRARGRALCPSLDRRRGRSAGCRR
jgi:hypothetical protein